MKRTFTRSEAIDILIEQSDPDVDEMPSEDFETYVEGLSNEELEEELCLTGYIHDEDMGGVVDD